MNRSQLSWYVGKVVYDTVYNKSGLVLRQCVDYTDMDGQTHEWDFDILYEDGELGHADLIELKIVTGEPHASG